MLNKILLLCLFFSLSFSSSRFDNFKKAFMDIPSSEAASILCQNYSYLETIACNGYPPILDNDNCVVEYVLFNDTFALHEAETYLDKQFCSVDFLRAFLSSKATFVAKFYNPNGSLKKTKRYNQYNRPSCTLLK